jgi:hypothetical protein
MQRKCRNVVIPQVLARHQWLRPAAGLKCYRGFVCDLGRHEGYLGIRGSPLNYFLFVSLSFSLSLFSKQRSAQVASDSGIIRGVGTRATAVIFSVRVEEWSRPLYLASKPSMVYDDRHARF